MGLPQNEVVAQEQAAAAIGELEQDLNILHEDVDEGLGDDGNVQEEQCSLLKINVRSAPSTRFCATISKVSVMTLDGVKRLCTSCYMLYIYSSSVDWHQHTDQHIQGFLHEIPRDWCYACNKMLTQLRLASVCYMCNALK